MVKELNKDGKEYFQCEECSFFYEDREKGFKNGQGKKPLFSHDKHCTRQICQSIRVFRESKNINSKSRLIDLAKYLNLEVSEINLHSSDYDCYLCTLCFIEWQKRLRMLEFYVEKGAESAADNKSYFESQLKAVDSYFRSVSYGHIGGSGSAEQSATVRGTTQAIYKQFYNFTEAEADRLRDGIGWRMVDGTNSTNEVTQSDCYFIVAERLQMKDRLNPRYWQLR